MSEWNPTNELRWVVRKKEVKSDGGFFSFLEGPPYTKTDYWLEQKHVWSPAYEEWGGETKWFKVPLFYAPEDYQGEFLTEPTSLPDEPRQEPTDE